MIIKSPPGIKLHKAIAQVTGMSRRAAERLIEEKKVRVDGKDAHIGQRIEPSKVQIEIDKLFQNTTISHIL